MRRHIEDMNPDGSGMHPSLRAAWESFRLVPIDDTPGEAPHASMRHDQLKSRRATWAWHASSNRLKQNIEDVATMLPQVKPKTDLQWLWDRSMSILQTKVCSTRMRNRRVGRKERDNMLYTMHHFRDFAP